MSPQGGNAALRLLNFDFQEPGEAPIGKPKMVRIERSNYHSNTLTDSITQVIQFDIIGRASERAVYRSDGSLSVREEIEHALDRALCVVRVFNERGEIIRIRRIVTVEDREESVLTDAAGEVIERTTARRDSLGRIVDARAEDLAGNSDVTMRVEYSREQTDVHAVFKKGSNVPPELDFVIRHEGNRVILSYSEGREHGSPHVEVKRHSVVGSVDAEGNWTTKTLYESDLVSGEDRMVASLTRSITYYSE